MAKGASARTPTQRPHTVQPLNTPKDEPKHLKEEPKDPVTSRILTPLVPCAMSPLSPVVPAPIHNGRTPTARGTPTVFSPTAALLLEANGGPKADFGAPATPTSDLRRSELLARAQALMASTSALVKSPCTVVAQPQSSGATGRPSFSTNQTVSVLEQSPSIDRGQLRPSDPRVCRAHTEHSTLSETGEIARPKRAVASRFKVVDNSVKTMNDMIVPTAATTLERKIQFTKKKQLDDEYEQLKDQIRANTRLLAQTWEWTADRIKDLIASFHRLTKRDQTVFFTKFKHLQPGCEKDGQLDFQTLEAHELVDMYCFIEDKLRTRFKEEFDGSTGKNGGVNLIRSHRTNANTGKMEYLVAWNMRDCPDTWEPEASEHIQVVDVMVQQYHANVVKKKRKRGVSTVEDDNGSSAPTPTKRNAPTFGRRVPRPVPVPMLASDIPEHPGVLNGALSLSAYQALIGHSEGATRHIESDSDTDSD